MTNNTTIAALLAAGLAWTGCSQASDIDITSEESESIVLASFDISNGNTVTIVGLPELDRVYLSETTPAGPAEQLIFAADSGQDSLLERFLLLTPAGTPVPRLIADLAEPEQHELLAGRDIIPDHEAGGHYEVDLATLGISLPPVSKAAGGSCGTGGADYFEDNHCDTYGPYGYGSSQKACDNGAYYNGIQRTSTVAMRYTYTRMAACNGTAKVRHYHHTITGWHNHFTAVVAADTVTHWYSYQKGLKHDRRARFDPLEAGAYVRGWTVFYDQITSNAP